MKPSGHIDKVMHRIGGEEVLKHRLRLKTTIMVVKQLALQGSSFRGHDESDDSLNPGNVLAWIGFATKLNDQINSVVLRNAPGNAKYTSPSIQKEILGIIANRVRCKIREEIGDSCFSILVDEAVDEAGREQMSIILRLQLALITSAKVCDPIWDFFSILDCIINVVKASPKRIRELQAIHKKDLDGMLDAGEIQSGQGANQMTSLKRSGPTRWGSHYHSILSIINMFNATCVVLEDLCRSKEGEQRAQARGASKNIKTFEFVFNLHLMKGIMDITDFLCQAFQQESVDIVAAVGFVSMAKVKLQKLRDEGWDKLLQEEYDVSSLAKLLEKLVETGMDARYRLICRLIRLVLTLPVSTATTERSFSAMKHVKTDLRNKMGDEFLADCLTIFFEREYVIGMDEDSIIDEFAKLKDRRVQLTL
ncbi:unnamed protein product [Linum trigynum]|uniref:Uncharacterized protein n=1 Tax=Linum trigynum TaxID=586398 RepID=A0AAV2ETI6_9ROSI